MTYYEELLSFGLDKQQEKGLFDKDHPNSIAAPEFYGIKLRLGNLPICLNLEKLIKRSKSKLPPEIAVHFATKNIYLITHSIGVTQVEGNAKVSELQYFAEIMDPIEAQTIDLFPKTKFKDKFKVEAGVSGAIKAAGNFSTQIPEELTKALSGQNVTLGGDMEIELSTDAKFVGKLSYSIQYPVVNATGVSTNTCTWILKTDDKPLLGDQLLIQTIALPKEVNSLTCSIKGLVKLNTGWLTKTKQQETSTQKINIKLD